MRALHFWTLAEDDIDAPCAETAHRLAVLRNAGRPLTTAVHPHAEHDRYLDGIGHHGKTVSTRQPTAVST